MLKTINEHVIIGFNFLFEEEPMQMHSWAHPHFTCWIWLVALSSARFLSCRRGSPKHAYLASSLWFWLQSSHPITLFISTWQCQCLETVPRFSHFQQNRIFVVPGVVGEGRLPFISHFAGVFDFISHPGRNLQL